jgi:FkbM family methyltransferase
MIEKPTEVLGRTVLLRKHTVDVRVWGDTFGGLYHVPPDVIRPTRVLDLGANIGLTAAHYRQMWPYCQVFAVELDLDSARVGMRNTDDEVRWLTPVAVAAQSGEVTYDRNAASDAYSILPGYPATAAVPAMTMLEVIRESGWTYVDFCKMDIEGTEWDVFEQVSEWGPAVHSLLVEVHGPGQSSETLLARAIRMLEEGGYKAVHHERHPQAVWAIR